jgi:Do/DeqQ family serine protease
MHHEDSKGGTSRAVPWAPIIAAALLLLLTGGAQAAAPWFGGETPSLAPMLEKVMPAVVNVATEGKVRMGRNPLLDDPLFRHFFDVPDEPRERKTQSLGSGVIVDAGRGLIITNAHVVANAELIAVKLRNGRKLDAKRVGVDAETDVAVIQVPAEGLTALRFGDSDGLKVGDFVVAIGNPFGLDQTVTSGIVSALGRSGLGIEGYEEFIQTDASINPGNSGGALVDLQGRLVGINTAIFSQSGGSIGIGFAIPINAARQVMEQLAQHGEVKRGQLGVQLQDLDPDLAEAFDLNQQEGAVVVNVIEGSPAAKAGLKAGDVVVAVNGRPVRNASDLRNRVGLLRIGDKITLEVLRKGLLGKNDRVSISATVAAKIDQVTSGSELQNPRLEGARFGDIPERSPAHGEVEGVMVYEVKRGSRAWQNGLREGDIVLSVNQVPVASLKEFLGQVNRVQSAVLLHVLRGNSAAFIVAR